MPFFSKVFKGSSSSGGGSSGNHSSKDASARRAAKENGAFRPSAPKARWDDAWLRTSVEPDEVQELLRGCTQEIKARALKVPFLILPFRPASDPSAAKAFIRNFFGDGREPEKQPTGHALIQELRMVEPLVLCSVCKWCWSRLPGGVVTWEAYELFTIGEKDSKQARDAFNTFIPISVASQAREKIIFDFFELLAAMAAHGNFNGLGGRKLSRLAGWWAFEQPDANSTFETGYKRWVKAADATSHLFFAYLRSIAPTSSQERSGVTLLPRALEALLEATEYPPAQKANLQNPGSKVVMIVEAVSPTPFTLIRRARDFRYRDEDEVLQRFSDYEDPEEALTDECRRVLRSISASNDTSSAKVSTSLKDPSWSRFEDMGFSSIADDSDDYDACDIPVISMPNLHAGLRSAPQSRVDLGRPTTPSWADFLSSGFADEKQASPAVLLPPDKVLPPISTRARSSQSQRRMMDDASSLGPGELANITHFELDDAFWWAWITSLSGEETPVRKAAFGRCALIETRIFGSSWLVMEELLKGAAAEPDEHAYVAEKKSRFTFSKKLSRHKSSARGANLPKAAAVSAASRTAQRSAASQQQQGSKIAPDQQARIQAAAAALQEKNRTDEPSPTARRGRLGESSHQKTQSVMTLQPIIAKEAAPALRWASSYDKTAIRAQYLGNEFAGRGSAVDLKDVLQTGDPAARSAQSPAPGEEADASSKAALGKPQQRDDGYDGHTTLQSNTAERGPSVQSAETTPRAQPSQTDLNGKSALSGGKDGASPQAATFFASQMPVAGREEQGGKPLPARPGDNSAAPRAPSSTKAGESAGGAPGGPLARQQNDQRLSGQPPVPPKQEAVNRQGRASMLQQPGADQSNKTAEAVPAAAAVQHQPRASLQGASRSSAQPGKPPSTPDQANQANTEPTSSPESSRNKLRKKNQPLDKGIKTIVGLKKTDDEPKPDPKPVRAQAPGLTSVAAARAALEAKAKENQRTSPSPSATRVTTKRYSTAGKNGLVEETGPTKPVAREEPRADPTTTQRPNTDVSASATNADRPISMAESSAVDPEEERRAHEAFGAFDQGAQEASTPVQAEPPSHKQAMPASAADAAPAISQPETHQHAAAAAPHEVAQPTPQAPRAASAALAPGEPARADDVSDTEEATADPGDRWAQIRKNAAERAARMSEEQSAVRTERTDEDGETSSDETIESRVARIKARVAELTGNMDANAHKD